MKRIELKLDLSMVGPLLDLMRRTADDLAVGPAVQAGVADLDEEWRATWRADLQQGRTEECRSLLAMFDREFFVSGVVAFDEKNAEPVLRACAALRLRLRARELVAISDQVLETGAVDPAQLEPTVEQAFVCYVFLATLQELIIRHLDTAMLEG
jgi:hypothetical protein